MQNNRKWLVWVIALVLSCASGILLLRAQSPRERITIVSDTSTEYQIDNTWAPSVLAWVTDEWPSVENASWVWKSEFVSNAEAQNGTALITFRRQFTLPVEARAISGTLQITADNAYEVLLNGVVIGADGVLDPTGTDTSYATVERYPLAAQPGNNELLVRVIGYRDAFGRAEPDINPAGLIFVGQVTYNVNQPPVAIDQQQTTMQETAIPITLTATDGDGDLLTYRVIAAPVHGALQGTAPNLNYTPQPGFTGADSFTFQVNDGSADSNVATVNITVLARQGSITGRVHFANQTVANAKVSLDNVEYATDSNGEFRIPAIAEGEYEIVAQALVDETPRVTHSEVTVQRNANSLVDLFLQMFADAPRLIRLSGQQTINGGQSETFPIAESVAIDADNRLQDIRIIQCSGGKVRLEIDLQFQLKNDNTAVNVQGEARLYYGDTCQTTARKATKSFALNLANGASATRLIYLESGEPKVSADIRLNLVNDRQTLTTAAPVTADSGGDLATGDGRLRVRIPAQAVTQTVTLQYHQRAPTPVTAPDTAVRRSVNPPVMITAQSDLDTQVRKMQRPYTLTMQYSDGQLQALGIDETTLNLLFWNGTTWEGVLPCTGCGIDRINNQLTAVLDHFTEFALVGTVPQELYLPMIAK